MKPSVVAFIFARGGSKGVPQKNIRPLAGKPLIAYSIETAKESKLINRVIVSTDDPQIAEIAAQRGAEVPFMRPSELARDDSPEWLAWQHAIRTLEGTKEFPNIDVFVSVPATSPLRRVEDVDACILKLLEGNADMVISVRPAARNPYFNMVKIDSEGYVSIVIEPDKKVTRRQDAPRVYEITTVAYAALPQFILRANSMFEGRIKAVEIPEERALDIDSELDFLIAEYLINHKNREPK